MKKIFKMAVMCCLAMVVLTFTACEGENVGQYMYEVTVSDDTSTGSYNSFKAYAESTVLAAVKETGAFNPTENQYYFVIEGSRKACDKKIVAAVNQGMDKVEAFDDYDSTVFVIDEVTLVVKCDGEILLSRKFKKQNNR